MIADVRSPGRLRGGGIEFSLEYEQDVNNYNSYSIDRKHYMQGKKSESSLRDIGSLST